LTTEIQADSAGFKGENMGKGSRGKAKEGVEI
jgi:hypothetical protein